MVEQLLSTTTKDTEDRLTDSNKEMMQIFNDIFIACDEKVKKEVTYLAKRKVEKSAPELLPYLQYMTFEEIVFAEKVNKQELIHALKKRKEEGYLLFQGELKDQAKYSIKSKKDEIEFGGEIEI